MPTKGEQGATNAVFEEFFQDYYKRRYQIYWMNFVRGIWFGLGALIGGTLILAVVLWLLALIQQVPFLGGAVEAVRHSIEEARSNK